MKILDGKALALKMRAEMKEKIAGMDKKSTCYPSRQSCFRFVTSIKKHLYRINHTGVPCSHPGRYGFR